MRTLFTFLIAAGAALALTPLVRMAAVRWGVLDQPGHRRVHRVPTPRLGGVAVCGAWLIALWISQYFPAGHRMSAEINMIAALGALTMLVGAWDDWRDMSGRVKLAGQVMIGSLLFIIGPRIDRISNPFGGELFFPEPLSYLLTVLWIVGMMNAINLIDGLDGLACGVVATASFGLVSAGLYLGSYTAMVVLAALAGACVGFLWFNFYPAKIFLGDSGSQFLGFALGAAALINDQYKVATAAALLVPLTALALPIYDTALAIFRRFQGHQSVFRADKYHLHHRLLRMGLSQRRIVLFFYLLTCYLGCLGFLFVLIPERYAVVLFILLALGLLMGIQTLRFLEFKLAQRRRRRRKLQHRARSRV